MKPLDRLLPLLRAVKKSGKRYTALCPAHVGGGASHSAADGALTVGQL